MHHRTYVAVAVSLCAISCGRVPSTGSVPSTGATGADISEADLRHRLFSIADDSMMGRESGSEGDFKTAAYIASEFKRLGLEAAGESGTYFQTVPFWRAAVDRQSRLTVGGTTLQVGRDFTPSSIAAPSRRFDATQAVYGGPIADSSQWATADQVAGKLVVLHVTPGTPLRGLPLGASRLRSAAAVAIDILDDLGPEQNARLLEGRPVADTARNPRAVPLLWVTRRAAAALLGAEPSTLAPGTPGQPVSGYADIARTPVPFPARNVVAILRGSDPRLRNEYVALTAHNDHVGFDHFPVDHDSLRAFNRVIRPMGADSPNREPTGEEWARIRVTLDSLRRANPPRKDSIRNGADDDGSGTVSILEIAERMANGPRPRRSILFVSHTGEEAGLLGSRWFTDHPTLPIDSIVAEIDEDMIGRGTATDFPRGGTGAGSPTYLEVVGAKRLSKQFGDTLEAANARQPLPFVFDYTYDTPGHPLQYYCRADHYSYARYGIPAVAFSRGEHLDYHQITDEPQYIDYVDLARVSRMVFAQALAIANMSERPKLSAPKPADPHGPCRQ
ncbi:MAG TPA: M28 family peptidase [Gemmatimonadaceae bacterium]|nr:M28 family peptidase [Gemmatimonadaceae bacterium]